MSNIKNAQVVLIFLFFVFSLLQVGESRLSKSERREKKGGGGGGGGGGGERGKGKDPQQQQQQHKALHQYKATCDPDGSCTYMFSLIIPAGAAGGPGGLALPDLAYNSINSNGNPGSNTLETAAASSSGGGNNGELAAMHQQLVSLNHALGNLSQLNKEETDDMFRDMRRLKIELAQVNLRCKTAEKHSRVITSDLVALRDEMHHMDGSTKNNISGSPGGMDGMKKEVDNINTRVTKIEKLFSGVKSAGTTILVTRPTEPDSKLPLAVGIDCASLRAAGLDKSGVYKLQPNPKDNSTSWFAYCDMETDGGGWTVIQRREDGSEDFNRNWQSYKRGFGALESEHWLGLEKMRLLNSVGNNRIRFDIWDWKKNYVYAQYDKFHLGEEKDFYRITVGLYNGTAGDAFHYGNYYLRHHRMPFSTRDRDNDNYSGNCASLYEGGWWYHGCMVGNLNGIYYTGGTFESHRRDGIMWLPHSNRKSMRKTEIKVRPANFKP